MDRLLKFGRYCGISFRQATCFKNTIGVQLEPDDTIHRIRGVGGTEFVFTKQLSKVSLGALVVDNFEVAIGAMGYGFDIEGIIGVDFLVEVGAILDMAQMEIYSG